MRVHAAALASSDDVAATAEQVFAAVRLAASDGADLVVLPEYSRAFDPRGVGRDLAEPLDEGFVPALRRLAAEVGVAVIAGTTVPEDDRAANVVVGVDATGALVGAYRKVHLYDAFGHRESERLVPGDPAGAPLLMRVAGLTVGVLTCYDLRFPESARRLVDAGAEVLVVPAAWAAGEHKVDHWATLLRARAVENTCYVVAAAQQGRGVVGRSTVVDPDGVVLAEAGHGPGAARGEAAAAELSADVVHAARERNPSLANRRFRVVPLTAADEASAARATASAPKTVAGELPRRAARTAPNAQPRTAPNPLQPRTAPNPLWDRWLAVAIGLVGLLGVVLAVAAQPAVEVFDRVFFGGPGPVSGGLGVEYLAFVYRVLGAVLIGWTVTLAAAWRALRSAGAAGPVGPAGPDARGGRDRRAWWTVAGSVGVWFLVDTTSSLVSGFPENALLNLALATLVGVPLAGMWRELR